MTIPPTIMTILYSSLSSSSSSLFCSMLLIFLHSSIPPLLSAAPTPDNAGSSPSNVVARQGQPAPNYQCPLPNGLFPDPESCGGFYHCANNVAYRKECQSGLVFNAQVSAFTGCFRSTKDKALISIEQPDSWDKYCALNQ